MCLGKNTSQPANVLTIRFPYPAQTQHERFAQGEEEQGSVCSFRLGRKRNTAYFATTSAAAGCKLPDGKGFAFSAE